MADSSHSILIPGEWSPGIPANLRGAFFHLALDGLSDATLADMNSHLSIFSQLIPFRRMHVGYLGLLLIPCLYWFAFKDITAPTLLSALNHWEISSLVVLGLLNLLILQAMSLRWGLILERSGHRVPLFQLVFYRLGANAISYLTPGPQFGGEPFQVHWLIRCHGIIPEVAAASVFVDRLVELITNLCFLLLVGIVVLQGYYFDTLRQIQVLGMVGLLCVGATAFARAIATDQTPLTRVARFGTERFGLKGWPVHAVQFLERGERQAASILNVPARVLWPYIGCAAIQWVLMLTEFWFIYNVLGVSLNPLQLLALMGAARLAFLLPLPGALGVMEAGQLAVLTTLNIDPVTGLASCLTMRARDLVLIGTGAVHFIHRFLHDRPKTSRKPLKNSLNTGQQG